MADLALAPQDNMIAYLEKTKNNAKFHHILDFLTSSSIYYSLTVSLTIYAFNIKQFWNTATSQTVNDEKQIYAIVDGKTVIITESSVRRDLVFTDANGITWGDGLVRVATNASLDAQQDSSNITNTQSKATLNEPTSHREGSGSGIGRQETMGDAMAQIRSEGALIQSIDPPLSTFYTVRSREDRMEHDIKLTDLVLDLKNVKTAQAKEIASLKKRVTKLEQNQSSRILGFHPFRADIDDVLDEDADTEMIVEDKGNGEKGGSTAETISTARPDISAVRPEMKNQKAKEKGIAFKDADDSARPIRSITTLKPLPTIDPKDKGSEEDEKRITSKKKKVACSSSKHNSPKKQKVNDQESEDIDKEHRKCLKVVLDDDKAIDYETLDVKSPIVDCESQVLGTNKVGDVHVYKLTRLDGSYRHFLTFSRMLEVLDRQDVLDLNKIIMERVQTLMLDDSLVSINMFVEKRYPLTKEILEKMLSSRFEAETESYKAGLKSVEERLKFFKTNEFIYSKDIKKLKFEIHCNEITIREIRKKLETIQREKDGIQLTVEKLKNASNSLNKLIDSHIVDNCKKCLRYNAVPPPHTSLFMPFKLDLSYISLEEFTSEPAVETLNAKTSEEVPKAKKFKSSITVNTARPVNTAHPKTTTNAAKPRTKAVLNVVKGNEVYAVKASLKVNAIRHKLMLLDKQLDGLPIHKEKYDVLFHTKKVFANIKRIGKGFSGKETPLFPTMMKICTTLQKKVLDLEDELKRTKTTQQTKIDGLERRVKKLKKKQKSRTHKLKRLYKVGLTTRVIISFDDEALDKEDISKQGRIDEIDADEDITLVSTHDDVSTQDNIVQDEGLEDVGEEEVVKVVTTAKMFIDAFVDAAQVTTAIFDIPVSAAETIVTSAPTITAESTKTNVKDRQAPKRKGVMIQEPEETTKIKTASSQQPQVLNKAEKLQAKMQANIDEEDMVARERERAQKEQKANDALINTWDDIQTKIEADA
nr:hypothetical protein [Tanacetum cinerariifolium]